MIWINTYKMCVFMWVCVIPVNTGAEELCWIQLDCTDHSHVSNDLTTEDNTWDIWRPVYVYMCCKELTKHALI